MRRWMKQKRKRCGRIRTWIERRFSGHVSLGPVCIYGFNAMHVAINIRTRRWGYICFHPPIYCFGVFWPWYFYLSPNATPWAATYKVGPGAFR